MKKKITALLLLGLLVPLVWVFVGVERVIGDHEMGITWEPFVKHYPSLQFRFSNPAQHGLDIDPFNELSNSKQLQFIEFCKIRFGTNDVLQCYGKINGRRI